MMMNGQRYSSYSLHESQLLSTRERSFVGQFNRQDWKPTSKMPAAATDTGVL